MVEKIILDSREDWLRHRTGIGGSDAAAIIGMNPYMSNSELWEMKTGRKPQADISEVSYVKYGTEAEKHLRELFKLDFPQYKVFYEENNMFLNDKYPWAHASLDGWLIDENGRKGIWECKTSNIVSTQQKAKWDEQIPQNYFCQVLHYLAVTESEFAVLKAQLKWEKDNDVFCVTKHYFIERADVEEDIKYLMDAEKEFYGWIKTDVRPPLILNL